MVIYKFLLLYLRTCLSSLSTKTVYRGIHVFFGRVGVDFTTIDTDRGFRLVSKFLDGEDAMRVDNQIEMTRYLVQLGCDVLP